MNLQRLVDMRLQFLIDDMRMGIHPARPSEIERQFFRVQTVIELFGPSPELAAEAYAELAALRRDAPAKPYQRFEVAVASAAAVSG